ncbi:TSG101 [Branchiostoma lanceolatum]|uniref:TSG101 protein n=1 Tax=Branchiostoma lanceolatum TaxID=7740 RepID=A0A8J9Z9J5_BRALA|nr:TSG101 [Branchiostoma lanceolatum]
MATPKLKQFLKKALAKYKHKDVTQKEVMATLKHFEDLKPVVDTYVFNDGSQTELLCLCGTIPVKIKELRGQSASAGASGANTYNIPVCIWLTEFHPEIPPLVYVRPTGNMVINESKHVDMNGRVYMPYLHEWTHALHRSSSASSIPPARTNPSRSGNAVQRSSSASGVPAARSSPSRTGNDSDLIVLIQHMRRVFSEEPPVFMRSACPPGSYLPAEIERILTDKVYRNRQITQLDVRNAVTNFKDLKVHVDVFSTPGASKRELLCLKGTVPVIYKEGTYNIPLKVWLFEDHPNAAPVCYVVPTTNMRINDRCKHVNANGKLQLPYLDDWKDANSDLFSLIQVMRIVFGEEPPVYALADASGADNPVVSAGTTSGTAPTSASSAPQQAADPAATDKPPKSADRVLCLICMDKKVDSVVYDCGHMCMCFECGQAVLDAQANCPMCRSKIKDIIRTYHAGVAE